MDFQVMSTAISQLQVQHQASMSALNQAMNLSRTNVDSLHKMLDGTDVQALQQSVHPNLGANVDVKA